MQSVSPFFFFKLQSRPDCQLVTDQADIYSECSTPKVLCGDVYGSEFIVKHVIDHLPLRNWPAGRLPPGPCASSADPVQGGLVKALTLRLGVSIAILVIRVGEFPEYAPKSYRVQSLPAAQQILHEQHLNCIYDIKERICFQKGPKHKL